MIEIMAPVGCYESLAAAIQAGAGSVYFGIQGLNMRSGSANNFTIGDLKKIADICKAGQMPENYQSPQEVLYPETARGTAHCKPLKSYLTVNTIMYDGDLDKMRRIIDAASEAGITAIIASDVAAMTYARGWDRPDRKPRIEVHLSTQLNISNIEALKFYAQFADVVVLARELNMDQVAAIHQEIVRQNIRGPKGELIRIEMFAHGALCMAVSG
ncbi:MAG: U32 family peptidase, partial [Bacteroidales bacterium]|nr:U32 family peptidase [Bacteroidales bacterium]